MASLADRCTHVVAQRNHSVERVPERSGSNCLEARGSRHAKPSVSRSMELSKTQTTTNPSGRREEHSMCFLPVQVDGRTRDKGSRRTGARLATGNSNDKNPSSRSDVPTTRVPACCGLATLRFPRSCSRIRASVDNSQMWVKSCGFVNDRD